jgi:hypothetical protein
MNRRKKNNRMSREFLVLGVLQSDDNDRQQPGKDWVYVNQVVAAQNDPDAEIDADNVLVDAANVALANAPKPEGPYDSLGDIAVTGRWNYWPWLIVALEPGLPIEYSEAQEDPRWLERETKGPVRGVIVFGESGGEALVQRFHATVDTHPRPRIRVTELLEKTNETLPMWGDNLEDVLGGVVEFQDGIFAMFESDGVIQPIVRATHVAKVAPDDLQVVNHHRRSLGMKPLDLADGWTSKEISDMAETIRMTGRMSNPSALKRKLLR